MVPAMLKGEGAASHVTMLQRTPTYIASMPRVDRIALRLNKLLGNERGYAATRFKNIWLERGQVLFLRRFPKIGRRLIRAENVKRLPKGFDVDSGQGKRHEPLSRAFDSEFSRLFDRVGHIGTAADEADIFGARILGLQQK